MKKFLTYLRVNWVQIVLILLGIALAIGAAYFVYYCVNNFFYLEPYTRRMISGQMALLLPMFVLVHMVSFPMMFAVQQYFMTGGGMSKSNAEMVKTNVKWSDVIGMKEAKQEAWELVKLLKDRKLVQSVGGKIIKGTMMIGPPGCGKTYLAKAIAHEADLPLLSAVGSDFVAMFVGVGGSRMRSLFKRARKLAKVHGGCIIFIDEIDSFARPRGADTGGGGRMDMNATINQFLTEMDGLRNTENNIAVIAATNVPENELDSAIMRAGRFDRKVHVTRPNLEEREEIFDFYLKKVKTEDVKPDILARKTVWFSPAEIESMIREGALVAMRDSRDTTTMKDLSEAYERVAFGQKSNIILSDKERYWVAYHETGHALIYYLCHPKDDVMKASVIPRGGALGYVFARPQEEHHCPTKEDLLSRIKVSIASYVVEKRKFGSTSQGVGGGMGSDFFSALQIAHSMVWSLGMGPSGLIGDFHALSQSFLGSPFISDKTKETLDQDTQTVLQTCLKQVEEIVEKHWDVVEDFAETLYNKEELEYDEVEAIFQKHGLERLMYWHENQKS